MGQVNDALAGGRSVFFMQLLSFSVTCKFCF